MNKQKNNVFYEILEQAWKAAKESNKMFWLLALCLITIDISLKPFNSFIKNLGILPDRYSHYAIAINGVTMMFTPLMGIMIDRIHFRTKWLFFSAIAVFASNIIFYAKTAKLMNVPQV